MPTTTQATVQAFAHCPDSFCPGNAQVEVEAIEETVTFRYSDMGGDLPGPERSTTHLRFVDDDDRACPHEKCEKSRELSTQKRPRYQTGSAYAQDGLLKLLREGKITAPGEAPAKPDQSFEIAALKAQLAEVKELLGQKANKPGPKPKADSDG